ncbi:proteasome activator complex subunit 3 isoform X2 [Daktulosphaira vitifoliae]|uniref:proteasome activator complex subunit 3 isoform X2 n=1 Tax=Daktulosphaira vitifoliae TaxID=58002 RepID=UPI0021AAD4E4|nr:proteasome activator complex subunit 3 isoform X2 [Daktulosphaira vitifoliae]
MAQTQIQSDAAAKAENRIVQKFPERIIHINELLKRPEFSITDMSKLKCSLGVPIGKIENNVNHCEGKPPGKRPRVDNSNSNSNLQTMIPSNKNLTEIIKIVKPNIKQLVEDTNALKMWVSLLIPKIEDGNNFGVSIQEDTLAEIQQVEVEASNYLDQISRYYAARAKLISKVVKYPYIEDYRRSVEELDEKQYLTMSLTMHEIRNRYSTMHDIVIKNFDKIKKPRSSNTESLY